MSNISFHLAFAQFHCNVESLSVTWNISSYNIVHFFWILFKKSVALKFGHLQNVRWLESGFSWRYQLQSQHLFSGLGFASQANKTILKCPAKVVLFCSSWYVGMVWAPLFYIPHVQIELSPMRSYFLAASLRGQHLPRLRCTLGRTVCWYTWLVVGPPLWKILVNWDDEIPNIWEKNGNQTTNQLSVTQSDVSDPAAGTLFRGQITSPLRSQCAWHGPPAPTSRTAWGEKRQEIINRILYIYIHT